MFSPDLPETSPKAGASGSNPRPSDCPAITAEDHALLLKVFGAGRLAALDAAVRKHTGFAGLADMVYDPGGVSGYRPSLYGAKVSDIADAYDKAQEARGDARRAYRG